MTNNFNFNLGLYAGGTQSAYSHYSYKPDSSSINTEQNQNKPNILESPRTQKTSNKTWFG